MASHSEQKARNEEKVPTPAYLPTSTDSPLYVNRKLYNSIAETGTKENIQKGRVLVDKFIIPIRSAKAWKVPAGHVCRLSTPEGPQVGDLNLWNLNNPRERFWAARTRQLHQCHVSTYDRLWSSLPFLRPMATIISDTLTDYGTDKWGGRCHDLLGTRCDPYVDALLAGNQMDFHCHSNLTRAVMPFGLTEYDVHDVLNVFQVTGLNEKEQYFMETCPSTSVDHFEFFAEIDLLCALSACPGGDLSLWGWGETDEDSQVKCCRPLGVEVYKIVDEELLKDWKEPEVAPYYGNHGLKTPVFEK
ncbi:uncharacterized protein SAPINGB_P005077 [Magnusiomyces paraingens]|uniref:DUF1989 domain-containing protein n=1 Tax=Magnusiomyces paraingens TaxID=2606893 RepID=A0A5E8C3U8_9ASCO|nr:uncharacterized protein SAPINGB_P005077 [Saprochaete ingens]VVT56468.1 unnamed protein product [Saprochaete ingens]